LQALRAESAATIEQVRAAQQTTIDELKAEHAATIESQVKSLEKKLAGRDLELKATQDDLAKAKANLANATPELEHLKAQLEAATRDTEAIAASVSADQAAEIDRLARELAASKDDLSAITEVLEVTKESISEMSSSHQRELEETARVRVDEIGKLRAQHAEEITVAASEKAALQAQLSDLQGELATLRAAADSHASAAPKVNGTAAPSDSGISREELIKLHEAHNLKLGDLKAEHEKEQKALQEALDHALGKADAHQQEVARKAMEVQYLEQEQDELNDEVARYVCRKVANLMPNADSSDRLKEHVAQLEGKVNN
jgi:chromosome segregation ATPase